jgi:hypothetical protein
MGPATTKPGALAPGVCLLSRGAFPRGSGAAVRSVDRFQIRRSLVVGRSCRRWHLGPGVHRDVPLGPGHLRRCSGRRVSPPGKTTPGTSVIRRECWSRGRIVSALLAAAQGGCRPSMEPPNPGDWCQQGLQHFRHRSSPGATGLHEGGFTRGSQGVSELHRPGRWWVPETVLFQAGTGTSQALRHWAEGVICS